MRALWMMGFLTLAGCSSNDAAHLESAEADPPAAAASSIDWSKNSELTTAPIVRKSCVKDACPTDPAYEMGLEKEFWRHIHQEDYDGMSAWYDKTVAYVEHSSERSRRARQIGRLYKLLAFSQGMMILRYDLHELALPVNTLLAARDLGSVQDEWKQAVGHPAIPHLLRGLGHGVTANRILPNDKNAQTVLLVVGSFAQAAMPAGLLGFQGMTGLQAYVNTLYGPTCKDIKQDYRFIFGDRCYDKGLMGPGRDAYKTCVDAKSCDEVGTGPEGLIAGAMSLVMLNGKGGAQRMLDMLGDGPGDDEIAGCDSYWCSVINPKDPNAPVPEATALTPFKKIGSLLAIAEAYGKVGKLAKMDRVLEAVRAEARRLNYPHTRMIDRVEASLKGGSAELGVEDLLAAWSKPDPKKDILGSVQFPLPVSGRQGNCASCHYGGVLPDRITY
jgi:hypothetical protein